MNISSVKITLSDPWDLGESLSWKPLIGEVVKARSDIDGGRALIRLNEPISYRGTTYQFAVATPRHEGDTLASVQEGGKVYCSFTGVSREHANSKNPLSTQDWRGGLAFIGDLQASTPETGADSLPDDA